MASDPAHLQRSAAPEGDSDSRSAGQKRTGQHGCDLDDGIGREEDALPAVAEGQAEVVGRQNRRFSEVAADRPLRGRLPTLAQFGFSEALRRSLFGSRTRIASSPLPSEAPIRYAGAIDVATGRTTSIS